MKNIWIILFLLATQKLGTCESQEKPFYTIPNYSNESVRQNFCPAQRLVEEGLIKRRDALRGMNLRIALFRYQLNAKTGAIDEANPGVAIDILDELSQRAGFQWRNTYGVADIPKGNKTWIDVLHSVSSKYDLVGDHFNRDEEMVELGILFSESWVDSSYIMVKKKDDSVKGSTDFFNFMRPFTYSLWILLGATLVVSGIIYYVLDYIDSKRRAAEMDLGFKGSMFNAVWIFTGHSLHEPTSTATRLLVLSLSFLCLLMVSAYTANLASFLVTEKTDVIVFNDINDVIRNGLSCCIGKNTVIYEFMKVHYPTVKLVVIDGTEFEVESYHAFARSECDILLTYQEIFDQRQRSSEFNSDCNLETAGEVIDDQKGYFPIMDSSELCASLVREVITLHLMEMKRDNSFDTIWANFHSRTTTVFCKAAEEDNEDTQKIGVSHMFGIFILYFVALSIAISWSLFLFYRQPRVTAAASAGLLQNIKMSIIGTPATTQDLILSNAVSIQQTDLSATDQPGMGVGQESIMSNKSSDIYATEPCPTEARLDDMNWQLQKIRDVLERQGDKQTERDRYSRKYHRHLNDLIEVQGAHFKKFEENQNKQLEELQKKVNEIEKKYS